MRVVVVSAAALPLITQSAPGATAAEAFAEVLGGGVELVVLSPTDQRDATHHVALDDVVGRVLRAPAARLARFPLGRLLNSLGPADAGRVLWRSVRRDRAAMELLGRADILVAADGAAVATVWHAARRYPAARALTDVDAALRVLRTTP